MNDELRRFEGNLVAAEVALESGERFKVMSVYCPAWPVDPERLQGVDVSAVKLENNPDMWCTELMWAALCNERLDGVPWIVGGDLNSSPTFDWMWADGPRGNKEVQQRMDKLGFVECLRHAEGCLTPTFRNPKGGKIIHQLDHLYVPKALIERLTACSVGDPKEVFDKSLSDHLPILADFARGSGQR